MMSELHMIRIHILSCRSIDFMVREPKATQKIAVIPDYGGCANDSYGVETAIGYSELLYLCKKTLLERRTRGAPAEGKLENQDMGYESEEAQLCEGGCVLGAS